MPYQEQAFAQLKEAYEKNLIDTELVDETIRRLFHFYERTRSVYEPEECDLEKHHQIAVNAARKSITLLKNENGALPVRKEEVKRILVVGESAADPLIGGDGSSRVSNPPYRTTPLEELKRFYGEEVEIEFLGHSFLHTYEHEIGYMEMELAQKAATADAVLIFANQDYSCTSEAIDRNHIELEPYLEHAIRVSRRVSRRVIVVLNIGSAVSTAKWNHCADAILVSWLGGQGMGTAVAETICGINNPGGKLPETFPKDLRDVESLKNYPGDGYKVVYKERLQVGYRHFDANRVKPEYEFGFGLSYSRFVFGNLEQRGDELSFDIANLSDVDGEEVAQVYISFPENSWNDHPVKELRYFKRVAVKAHETVSVHVKMTEELFQYYNAALHKWMVECGAYTIWVGNSSRNLPLRTTKSVTFGYEEGITYETSME